MPNRMNIKTSFILTGGFFFYVLVLVNNLNYADRIILTFLRVLQRT